MGFTRRTMSRTGAASGLTLEGGVASLGHVGGAVHPVEYGRRVRLRYGLDKIVQALALPDGDGVADIHFAADGYHGVGVAATVGPHREWSFGPSVAHPPYRLTQEMSGAPSGVGATLAQPSQQHVAGATGHGQQRVIAPLAGVAMVSAPSLADP